MDGRAERANARTWIERLGVRPPEPGKEVVAHVTGARIVA